MAKHGQGSKSLKARAPELAKRRAGHKHLSAEHWTQGGIIERQERSPVRPHSHNPQRAAREPRTWSER